MEINQNVIDRKPKTWSKSIEKDGITKSIRVEEAINGFVVRICTCGDVEQMDGTTKWMNSEKTYISQKNPLEDKAVQNEQQAKNDANEWTPSEMLNSIADSMGMIEID